MRKKILFLLNILFPLRIFQGFESFKPLFCRHEMEYWDMEVVIENSNDSYPLASLGNFNGRKFTDYYCQCVKCGIQKKKSMIVGKYGKYENTFFKPTSNGIILLEIQEYGKESKSQKRDRILNELGI